MSNSDDDDLNVEGLTSPTRPGQMGDADNPAVSGDDIDKLIGLEKQAYPDETDAQRTRRLFKENSSRAASQIINIAMHGSTERLKLDASKYIVERVLGPVGNDPNGSGDKTPLEEFFGQVTEYANDPTNKPNEREETD